MKISIFRRLAILDFHGIHFKALSRILRPELLKSTRLSLFGYAGYIIPHVNNVNFPKNDFALFLLHTTEINFGKQKQHEMKERG